LIIHLPAFFDVLGLERDLQAAAAHAKRHGVHVDVVLFGRTFTNIVILWPVVQVVIDGRILPWPWCVLVFEDRHIDFDLPTSSPADVGC
jgi:hypothetical protein